VSGIDVVSVAVVTDGRLLVVSKRAAPDVFYLPGGKPEPGETPEQTLRRELEEELGVRVVEPKLLGHVESVAALEGVPMRLTVFTADLDGDPQPAAELAAMAWLDSVDDFPGRLSPTLTGRVIPLLRDAGVLPKSSW